MQNSEGRSFVSGASVPRFLYGTAWKEDRTQRLTELALAQGFRGIDTANQRRHYHEAGVGAGNPRCDRPRPGGARRAVPADEVHIPRRAGPPPALRSRSADRHTGRAVVCQLARSPGDRLHRLVRVARADAAKRPGGGRLGSLAGDGGDSRRRPRETARRQQCQPGAAPAALRSGARAAELCAEPLLRLACVGPADPRVLHRPRHHLSRLLAAHRQPRRAGASAGGRPGAAHGRTAAQIVFRFAVQIGMLPLTGTSDEAHMRDDLAIFDFQLTSAEVEQVETVGL